MTDRQKRLIQELQYWLMMYSLSYGRDDNMAEKDFAKVESLMQELKAAHLEYKGE